MAWGKKLPSASTGVGQGPFSANYNRAYDTHTEHNANRTFANNDINYADQGPDEYSGTGKGDSQSRKYVMPNWHAPSAVNGDPGYLGEQVGPRELQTGNAPSGGYTTRPGLGFTANQKNVVGVEPDIRRMAARNRSDDWELNDFPIHDRRDAEYKSRRAATTREDWTDFEGLPYPGQDLSPSVNAIEDSPYRKDWPFQHGREGMAPGSVTWNTNPNKWRNFNRQFFATNYATGSGARYNNGTHYSMAVHQTLTPYGPSTDGANPIRGLRNTYRVDPAPWDSTNTDGPANTPSYRSTTNMYGGPQGGTSSYRLM